MILAIILALILLTMLILLIGSIILCVQEDTTEKTYGNGHKINPDDWEC